MTPTARPLPGFRARTSRVLLVAAVCVVLAGALAAVVAGLTTGGPGARGALVGSAIALVFFLSGSLVVAAATRIAPETALLVALTTYALQVVVVALVFFGLRSSGLLEETLAPGWVAGGVVVATAAWTIGQLVASARARVPAYDIELPGPAASASVDPVGVPSRADSQRPEAGAP